MNEWHEPYYKGKTPSQESIISLLQEWDLDPNRICQSVLARPTKFGYYEFVLDGAGQRIPLSNPEDRDPADEFEKNFREWPDGFPVESLLSLYRRFRYEQSQVIP